MQETGETASSGYRQVHERSFNAVDPQHLGPVEAVAVISFFEVLAASACMPGRTCWWVSIVKAGVAWPRRPLTTLTGTPALTSTVDETPAS
jgi:hypothetical protein